MFTSLLPLACLGALLTTTLATAPETINGFKITWSEDFSASTLNLNTWNRVTGIAVNNEQQTYTGTGNQCEITSQKTLLITPQNNAGKWTSCRIESIPAFVTTPGKQMIVQSRFKLGSPGSKLQGIWPAFWSLGEAVRHGTQWPACGEIDTFENINGQSVAYGTVHCGTHCNDPTGLSAGMNFDYGNFHTWAHAIDMRSGDWKQQSITWYMDGQAYHVLKGGDVGDVGTWGALVGKSMFLTLNVAVGGDWAGSAAQETVGGSAAGMEVQYVAVYESV